MKKYLYSQPPVQCIIAGPSNVGKSVVLINMFLNVINE